MNLGEFPQVRFLDKPDLPDRERTRQHINLLAKTSYMGSRSHGPSLKDFLLKIPAGNDGFLGSPPQGGNIVVLVNDRITDDQNLVILDGLYQGQG